MSAIEPLRFTTNVRLGREQAFGLFTARMETWWPFERFSRAVDQFEEQGLKVERLEFQGSVGGRILEHLSNGEALPWAEVLTWEPPERFVLAWKPNSNENPPTEVEVRFAEGPDGTTVELEHRGWERLGELAPEARSAYGSGWPTTLSRFAEAAEREVER